jgi:hypothetical protein
MKRNEFELVVLKISKDKKTKTVLAYHSCALFVFSTSPVAKYFGICLKIRI